MNDDFRPSKGQHRFISLDRDKERPVPESPEMKAAEGVDELKLEQEFGPPPNAAPASSTASPVTSVPTVASEAPNPADLPGKNIKVMKLIPSVTKKRRPRVELILLAIAVIIVATAAVSSYVILHRYNPKVLQFNIPSKVPPKPKTVASTLSGLQVDPSVNERPVTAVMIENSLDARPQSGLDEASVVFEALAEGGVTRFMALYQDTQPDYLGPVRSARPYYIQWLLGFDAAYAHVGGSPDALSDITAWHVKDLNQFYNSGAYQRISSRYAPHNVYTSIAQLNQVEASKGYGKSNYTGFVRKSKEEPSKTPTATTIDMTFSGYYYNSHFDYDTTTNTYKRSESGAPHMELHKDGSQVQIAPKVVIAMAVPEQNGALDSSGAFYANYATIGSGQVVVFQDGIATPGTWTKTSNDSQITFTGADGKALALNPGQTWICAITTIGNVTYK